MKSIESGVSKIERELQGVGEACGVCASWPAFFFRDDDDTVVPFDPLADCCERCGR